MLTRFFILTKLFFTQWEQTIVSKILIKFKNGSFRGPKISVQISNNHLNRDSATLMSRGANFDHFYSK